MTHNEIQYIGAKWLKRHKRNLVVHNCPYVAENLVTLNGTGETPDIIGWNYCNSTMIEVKRTRQDFLKDKKKFFRENSTYSMGNYRLYLCPIDLININEIPEKWGLLYIDESGKIEIMVNPEKQDSYYTAEISMLLSIIRRLRNGENKLV